MEIIKTNIANLAENKKLMYKLTRATGLNAKDCDSGDVFNVRNWVKFNEIGAKGGVNEVLSIDTAEGVRISTTSPTFKSEFDFIADLMGNEEFAIRIVKATSKNGREYVSCELICD